MEIDVSMDILVASLIIMDILIISNLLLIFSMVSIGFSLFKSIIMVTSNTTIANWDKNNLQAVTNRFAIIFAINMLISSAIALILHVRQQREQILIDFDFNQYIWYGICYSNNGYNTQLLAPIEAINYDINGCDTAPNDIEYVSTCRILDLTVQQVSVSIVYVSISVVALLLNMICNNENTTT